MTLPLHWNIAQKPVCQEESVIKGKTWRITVLTPKLIRFEYCRNGMFEDRATQFALNRNFPPCKFEAKENADGLEIETKALRIRYDKKPFSKNGLSVALKSGACAWHYGDALQNLGGTVRTLDEADGKVPLEDGVLSTQGIAVVDDSKTLALEKNGWLASRADEDGHYNSDIYVFAYGRNYTDCLKDFYGLTGPTPLLPRYALGNWWSRYHKYTEKSYKELIEKFQAENIPFSVAVIDMDWHVTEIDPALGHGWTGFTWNREFFPEPKAFLQWLHDNKLKTTLNLHPADGIRAHEEAYHRIAKRLGVNTAEKKPVLFDASNPEFLRAYFEEVLAPLEEEGVDFWWIDWQQGQYTKVPGLDPLWVLNHFHYLDNNKNGRRPMAFSRYAGLGSHRYPVGFSGDTTVSWDSLDFQPYFTATASNSGYGWWSHDIGGHMHGKRDDELAVRWVQFGVFSPINRLHSSCSPFNSKEPWRFLPWAESVMKKFLRLRHALVPYLYSMNLRASRDGMPLVQPMYYADPYNEKAYNVPNQYYFGTELVVCPITKPIDAEARAACFVAWIPNGVWIDFFNGRVYSGGRNLELWRDVEAPAVLAKAGGIVPMSADDTRNSVEAPENLDVFVFAGANGEFSLMEDTQEEAVGKNQTKQWAETKFCLDWSNGLFKIYAAKGNIDAVPKTRSWKIHFCGFEETTVKMEIHGKTAYCKKNKRLTVELPKMDSGTEICIRLGETVLAQNDVEQTAFDFLDNAWIAYDTKSRAFDAIKSGKATTAIIAELQAMDELPRPVFSGLCEILCAF